MNKNTHKLMLSGNTNIGTKIHTPLAKNQELFVRISGLGTTCIIQIDGV